jgi:hypothetical protein
MSVRHTDSCTTLPYRALITRIIQHARVVTDGMVELATENGPITVRYLNASNAHLRDAALAPRPRRRRTARVDGSSTSANQDKWLDRMEASLWTYEQTLQCLTQAVQKLRDHLMGPIDVRDYDIYSSNFNRGRGSPSARRSPSARESPRGRVSPSAKGTPG